MAGFAQNSASADSLVRLVEARSAHLIEVDGTSYRKIVGPATFLHNNTYLKCDTALWNVNTNIIDALGNVEILQENTRLTSDRIEYVADENLAKFRGSLVQLSDRDGNILNTNFLNYNTKDSIATFFNGAAMRNNDGSLIESIQGNYFSKEKLFVFSDSVAMFTDSVLISTTQLKYHTDTDIAEFSNRTLAWRDSSILYANYGQYVRPQNLFIFEKDSYILTREQELWADKLMYYRTTGHADLYENVQVLDTVQKSIGLAHKATYRPSPRRVELTREPAVGMYSYENEVADTLFLAADTILYYTRRMCEIDSASIALAQERLNLSAIDPIAIHDNERRAARQKKQPAKLGKEAVAVKDTSSTLLADMADSLKIETPLREETVEKIVPAGEDTTQVDFIDAYHNVRFYRSDVQGRCDSLVYTGLDSMARFYSNPVMWHEGKNQFTADSIQALLKNRQLSKINLLTNAFIAMQEDSIHFNQIRSLEMAAYFANNELYRFDALGGVSAIFFMEEDSTITLMDREECKLMTAKIKDNQIQRTRSIQELKQNVFPIYNLPLEEQRLKGFQWRGEERPVTRFDVTDRKIKPSKRLEIESISQPGYVYTKKYFPELYDRIIPFRRQEE
ncbi:MAG: hypothetical protein IJ476_07920 [Bacteroidales bacterium]|nr:hypothetical protein [Bacteroidales bacterium]